MEKLSNTWCTIFCVSILSTFASAGTATQLSIAAGDLQTAQINAPVPGIICAIVADADNIPVSGVTVTWGNITGGGTLSGETQVTGANGVATLGSWTLGPVAGINTITASATGLPTVKFSAVALAPVKLAVASGNYQCAMPGSVVPAPISVRVSDSNNTPVPGVPVTWSNVNGGGAISGEVQVTDVKGMATLGGWSLGNEPGPNVISAVSPGLPAAVFHATGLTGATQDNVVVQWDSALLQAIQVTNMAPPQAARAISMVHTGIFDAWAAYDSMAVGTQLGAQLRRPASESTLSNKADAVSFAAYRILNDLFPTQPSIFNNLMSSLGYDATNTSTDTSTPEGIGNTAAVALLKFRHSDGSNQLGDLNPGAYSDYTSYQPVNTVDMLNNPNRWQPLLQPNGQPQQFLVPQWGLVTPFAIGTGTLRARLLPKPPAMYMQKKYVTQAQEILNLSATLNDTTKSIAAYWADTGGTFTPPGHWCQIAQYVSQRDNHTLDDDTKMFFALGNGLLDASIEVWDCKRHYDSIRPISAIHFLFKGQNVQAWGGPGMGTQTILGEQFQSYIPTPPFPEHVSGHSTFSAVAAQILASFTRSQKFGMSYTIPAGSSTLEPNTPAMDVTLTWPKFIDAANEAGISRRYGGIHFKNGDLYGRALGKTIGGIVWKKALEYISGKVK